MTTTDLINDAIGHLERARQQVSHSPTTWCDVMDALCILDDALADVEADVLGTDEQPTRDWEQYLLVTDWARQHRDTPLRRLTHWSEQANPVAPSLAGDGR